MATANTLCVKCQIYDVRGKAPRPTWCDRCVVLGKYGLSSRDFNAKMNEQEGKCPICEETIEGTTFVNGTFVFRAAVDHDHKTKKIRGLLCHVCNRGLGHFRDNPERLISAAQYLRAHSK